MAIRLPTDPDGVDDDWLTAAIGIDDRVVGHERFQIGTGQVGANFRYHLRWAGDAGPATIVIKFAALDEVSRMTGVATGTYDREVAFYREIADTVDIARPRAFHVDIEPGTANVVVVMEDLAPREQGDQIAGCSLDHAELAVIEAARLHGPRWADPSLDDVGWLNRRVGADMEARVEMVGTLWTGFVDRYTDQLTPEALDIGQRLIDDLRGWFVGAPPPVSLTHGDYRLDNMLFAPAGADIDRPLVVVDWQTPGHGHGASDVAYFLGAGLDPDVRAAGERDLVERYHRELTSYDAAADVTWDEVWENYRRYAFSGFLMAVTASMIVGRTERGDEMFMAMANRHARQAIDLDSVDFLG